MVVKCYRPWNNQVLSEWIESELSAGKQPQELANELNIPLYILQEWRTLTFPNITLEQLESLARYRQCSLNETAQRIGICPAHLEMLVSEIFI